MNTLLFSSIQTLSSEQISQGDETVFSLAGTEEKEIAWKQLHEAVLPLSLPQLAAVQHTYVKWYTYLTWGNLFFSCPKKEISRIIDVTFASAIQQDVRIWENIIMYLHLNALDEEDVQSLYQGIRTTLLSSKQVLCRIHGHDEVALGQFFDSLSRYEVSSDKLVLAQFLSDIQSGLAADITQMGFTTEPKKAIDVLRDFAHFLAGIKPERIFVVVDSYMYPQKYAPRTASAVEPADASEDGTSDEGSSQDNTEGPAAAFHLFAYINDMTGVLDVRDIPTEQIIAILESLSAERGDVRIRDVYYYNEQTAAFEWDEALLKELELVPKDFDMSAVNKKD